MYSHYGENANRRYELHDGIYVINASHISVSRTSYLKQNEEESKWLHDALVGPQTSIQRNNKAIASMIQRTMYMKLS
jgi:hypothetical protein